MFIKKVLKKVSKTVKRARPSKETVSVVAGSIEVTFQVADAVANATSITPLQTATGLASGLIKCCKEMKGNYKKSQELAEGAQQLLKTLDDVKECDMNDAVRTALDCLVMTLCNIEEDMLSVAKSGRFRKLIHLKGNQEKIQDCTSRLSMACNAFQVKIGMMTHTVIVQQHSDERARLDSIGDDVKRVLTTCNGIGEYPWPF
ncbi:hypothetical protein CERSUDRAFT_97692 [Gelatoporia subvermispora B]|uniref:Fungal N-terminal domain-containing protein n=1 Tax=Ceriporiopsis subvermispora (strain B) TaxID=914234 RepID=M2R7Q7_CERS8|nr:hypothetical protein CERSUDRAFT_97692 [Gelatoporia subvermispora B]